MAISLIRGVAVVAVAAVALGVAACGDDDPALTERTLRFEDREGSMNTSVDAAPRTLEQEQITPGDQIVTTRDLLDESGDRVGIVHSVCTVTDGENEGATQACQGVFELKEGRLSFSKTAKLSEPTPPPMPVTGGTGEYAGATGTITATGGPNIEVRLFVP